MRLLGAELRKLNRPLMWALVVFAAAFCVMLAIGAANNARLDLHDALREGGARAVPNRLAAATVANQLSPGAAGVEAAGMMASMPGAFLAAMLAGGHVGGEWTGRTLKNVLAHNGYRGRVLAAKAASTWLALVVVVVVCWAVLAASGTLICRANGLPHATEPFSTGLSHSGAQLARALLVLAFFAVVGLLAAVLTRGTVGTIAGSIAAVVALLALGTLPTVGKWTPATWVEAWMGFTSGDRTLSTLPDNFWSRFTASGAIPGHLFGLAGMAGAVVVPAVVAWQVFRRADVV